MQRDGGEGGRERERERERDREREREEIDRQTDRQRDRERDRDRETDRQTDRQTERQRRQTDRQTDREHRARDSIDIDGVFWHRLEHWPYFPKFRTGPRTYLAATVTSLAPRSWVDTQIAVEIDSWTGTDRGIKVM